MTRPRHIDLASRTAALDDGRALPITEMLDWRGELTENPRAAVVVIFGADGIGWWAAEVLPEDRAVFEVAQNAPPSALPAAIPACAPAGETLH